MKIIKKAKLLSWENPYINNGLVAMWDAEWNAPLGRHDPTATHWTDIINGYVGVKMKDVIKWQNKSCSIENGYFLVDPLPDQIKDAMNADTFTWEVCRNYKSGSGQYTCIQTPDIRYEFWASGEGNTNSYLSWHSPSFTAYCGGGRSLAKDTRSFTIDGTTIKGYNGGELYAVATFTPVGEIKNAALQLGSLRGIAADLYCIRIYNRALSAEEISANYTIDKRRFFQ